MPVVRVVVMLFLTFYSYSMGQLSDLNGFGKLVAYLFFLWL